MGRGKKYSATDARIIFDMKEKGYSNKEIAEVVHRTTDAIRIFLERYRPVDFTKLAEKMKKEELPSVDEVFDDINTLNAQAESAPGFVNDDEMENIDKILPDCNCQKEANPAEKTDVVKVNSTSVFKSIVDCSDEELFDALEQRGYRFKENSVFKLSLVPVVFKKNVVTKQYVNKNYFSNCFDNNLFRENLRALE